MLHRCPGKDPRHAPDGIQAGQHQAADACGAEADHRQGRRGPETAERAVCRPREACVILTQALRCLRAGARRTDGFASCLLAQKGVCHLCTGPPLSERSSLVQKPTEFLASKGSAMREQQAAEKASKLIQSPVAVPDTSQAALSAAWEKLGKPNLALRHPCHMGDCKRLTWCLASDQQMYRL